MFCSHRKLFPFLGKENAAPEPAKENKDPTKLLAKETVDPKDVVDPAKLLTCEEKTLK